MKRSARIAARMFLLGHLGIGLGLAWLLSTRSSVRIDYRLILLGSILPDLIDKPLAFLLSLEGRLWAHTFLFLFAILALSFVPSWRGVPPLGFGGSNPLLFDPVWEPAARRFLPGFRLALPPPALHPGLLGLGPPPH